MDTSTKLRTLSTSKKPHVCVVGAGVAGLRCADILLQNGFEVTILEGRDRVGGRMYQTALPSGHLVDLGPNWIHGTGHNPIFDLAKETNTEVHTWSANSHLFGDDGKVLSGSESRSLGNIMWGIIKDAFDHSNQNSSTIDANESLYDFYLKRVNEKFPGTGDDERKRKILLQMSEMWGVFVGSAITRQSLKFFWLEECLEGENLFCAGTYQKILGHIAKPAVEMAQIKFSTRASRITTKSDGVTVITDDGNVLEFDEVVMTTPLGWLKQNKNTFDPPLPDRLHQAIDSIGYGSLEKVYITFPRAFWLQDGIAIADQSFTGLVQWMSPQYSIDTNSNRWNQEVVELASLPPSCAHPTILFYIFGDQSQTLADELAALPSQKERDEHIKKFFKPYYSLLPNYSEGSNDCVPESSLATSWVRDDLAGNGSYCNFPIGLREGDKDIEVMREGLPGRSLWFAGEHTAPFVALGTVTGAYWAGESVGKRISDAFGKTPKDVSIIE